MKRDAPRRDRMTYQWMLRLAGAYLDGQDAVQATILETPGGFALRFERAGDPTTALVQFDYDALVTLDRMLQRRRQAGDAEESTSESEKGTYQDVLRALGWELDDAAAYNVLVDQIEDELLLTFLQSRPEKGAQLAKRSAKLDLVAREAVLREAYGRRRRPKRTGLPGESGKLLG